MRDDLNDAMRHVKDAARSSLMAVRTFVDFALNKLDGNDTPADRTAPAAEAQPDDAPGDAPRDEPPPPAHSG
jgi:hypothetical protein